EGCPFSGCLYFGLMLTPNGAKVIEYNARFGDPEAQVVLPLLETPLIDIVEGIIDNKLDAIDIKWKSAHAACVIQASGGYPVKHENGKVITGLDGDGQRDGVEIFHAGTKSENGKFVTKGGRVLGITALGDTLKDALNTAYSAAEKISFDGVHFRRDIGGKCD
ncbi:MAG: phosphoribosylamine--glycine ligase, partial [Oscillospiraceae bacterium]|nr:phosphoribosylamine--glycine ligase [Oscillospiraceae bacterium]